MFCASFDFYDIGKLMCVCFSGSAVNVTVNLEREDEVTGPVITPFFPQVGLVSWTYVYTVDNWGYFRVRYYRIL